MQSIKEKLNKIKEAGARLIDNQIIFTTLIILLTAFSSFGLGRLSKTEENKIPISIQEVNVANISTTAKTGESDLENGAEKSRSVQPPENGGKYVVSKNGNKYHAPWCSGAQRIKIENQIWFDTKEEAETAGYTPAANCKGI
ncbi:MAG: hypothetical protein ABIG87_00670 [Patescibacteria group bacterium]